MFLNKNAKLIKLPYTTFNLGLTKKILCGKKLYSSNTIEYTEHGEPTEEKVELEKFDDGLIEAKRNKSGLKNIHYRIFHKQMPNFSEDEKEVMPLWKYRKLYGRYGSASGVNPMYLWPSDWEMKLQKEREALEYPLTAHEMLQKATIDKIAREKEIMDRQDEIKEKLKTLQKWRENINNRLEKKKQAAQLALEAKQKQIDDVREILGYNISPYDPKFEEILLQKEEEDKKRLKKEKKLRKQQVMLEKLTERLKKEAIDAETQQQEEAPPAGPSLLGKKIE